MGTSIKDLASIQRTAVVEAIRSQYMNMYPFICAELDRAISCILEPRIYQTINDDPLRLDTTKICCNRVQLPKYYPHLGDPSIWTSFC